MVPFQALHHLVLLLADFPLLQLFLPSLPHMRHIPRQPREDGRVEHQGSTVRDVGHDVQTHGSRPLRRIPNGHEAVLEHPADERKGKKQPAPEGAVVGGAAQPDEQHRHEDEGQAVGDQDDAGDGARAAYPRNNAGTAAGAWLTVVGLEAGTLERGLEPVSAVSRVEETAGPPRESTHSAWE